VKNVHCHNNTASRNCPDSQDTNYLLEGEIARPSHSFSFLKLVKVVAPVLYHPPVNLAGFRLGEIDDKRHHATQYEEDAHQIIEDFRENHYDNSEDKGDDPSS
jgi:hypothetical protein